jgi:hypothetical protein
MIIPQRSNGDFLVIGQTDHSRLVGQFAANWGNKNFASPKPYESVVRSAVFHDYGWLTYEANPLVNSDTGKPYEFRSLPFDYRHLESYQWCIDWLTSVDRYSGLIASMHRTGLWKGRYGQMNHPENYAPGINRAEIQEFVARNEAWQARERASLNEDEVWTNYCLQQVWDLLGLYFCCQEPFDEYIEPVPVSYDRTEKGIRITMKPVGDGRVAFDPYPFDQHPLKVQVSCKRLPSGSFADLPGFQKSYFQAQNELIQYELI